MNAKQVAKETKNYGVNRNYYLRLYYHMETGELYLGKHIDPASYIQYQDEKIVPVGLLGRNMTEKQVKIVVQNMLEEMKRKAREYLNYIDQQEANYGN